MGLEEVVKNWVRGGEIKDGVRGPRYMGVRVGLDVEGKGGVMGWESRLEFWCYKFKGRSCGKG